MTTTASDYTVSGTQSVTIPAETLEGSATVTFTPVEDRVNESRVETVEIGGDMGLTSDFFVRGTTLDILDAPTIALIGEHDPVTLTHSIRGGGYDSVTVDDVTVTVNDDDTAASWTVSVSAASIAEDGGESTVTVSTGGVTYPAAHTIALSLSGTATKTTDYTIGAESLTLAAGATSVTTTVTAEQDTVVDPAETVVAASHGGTPSARRRRSRSPTTTRRRGRCRSAPCRSRRPAGRPQ